MKLCKKPTRIALCCLIACGMFGGMAVLWRNANLMSRAVPVYRLPGLCYYHWLSDHELLLTRGYVADQDRMNWQLVRRDVTSGKETALPQLSRRLSQSVDAADHSHLSPDSRWLLWREAGTIHAMTMDGTQVRSWSDQAYRESYNDGDLYWQNDSLHFVELIATPDWQRPRYGVIRNVQDLHHVTVTPIPAAPELAATSYYVNVDLTPGGELFTWAPALEETARRTLLFVPLISGGPARKYGIVAPPGLYFDLANRATSNTVAISPNNDRIASVCHSAAYSSLLANLLQRTWPRWRSQPRARTEICVSDANGAKLHSIGGIEMNEADWDEPCDIRWLPDGHHLSFVFRDTLYVVPVD